MAVIGELLGVDPAHHDRLPALSERVVATGADPGETLSAHCALLVLLGEVAETRAAAPGGDLTSALTTARDEGGGRLAPAELLGPLFLLVVAGHGTTLHLVTNAVRALCSRRDQLASSCAGMPPGARPSRSSCAGTAPSAPSPSATPPGASASGRG